jgi:outer membrane protein OmpA-like peptidoglycan-associated protein
MRRSISTRLAEAACSARRLTCAAAAVCCWLWLAQPAAAASLDTLQGQWPALGLKASLAAPTSSTVEQGADLQIRLSSETSASLAIALEDQAHEVRIHVLHRPDTADQLVPGTELLYPDLGFGETLYADAPVGRAILWVIASDKGIFTDSGPTAQHISASVIAKRVEEARAQGTITQVTAARIPIEVVSPALKDYVSAQDFVSFYAVRTRSVSGADRGFRIGFKHNSAELDDWSRKQLEAVGEGMRDPQLASYHFAIEGHTDDTGTPDYNMDLSLRRAQAVRDFLAQQTHVPAARLSTKGFGKTHPAATGTDEAARAQNRRVVIRRLDPSAP